jgi:hypothetical protein
MPESLSCKRHAGEALEGLPEAEIFPEVFPEIFPVSPEIRLTGNLLEPKIQ